MQQAGWQAAVLNSPQMCVPPLPPQTLQRTQAAAALPLLVSLSKRQCPAATFQGLTSGENTSNILPAVPPHIKRWYLLSSRGRGCLGIPWHLEDAGRLVQAALACAGQVGEDDFLP